MSPRRRQLVIWTNMSSRSSSPATRSGSHWPLSRAPGVIAIVPLQTVACARRLPHHSAMAAPPPSSIEIDGRRFWPRDGLPSKPESWLLTAARHRLLDQQRKMRAREQHEDVLGTLVAGAEVSEDSDGFPDERLRLFFVCAHPAIDPEK